MKTFVFLLCLSLSHALDSKCMGTDSDSEALSEPVTPEVQEILNQGERAFAVNLIKILFQEFSDLGHVNKNIFLSPASVYQALTLAYMGARGQTEAELEAVLGFQDKVNRTEAMKNYLFERVFQSLRDKNPDLGYKLTHANKFYFDRNLKLSQCLQLVLRDELEALDFSKTQKSINAINGWVKSKTEGKISKLLPNDALDGGSKVALVNAAYFKGNWASKFDSEDTKLGNFYINRGETTMTKYMVQKGKFNYYTSEELRAHVLEMPYEGDEVSMIIILPPFQEDSLIQTVSKLTPENLQGVMAEVRSGFYQMDELNIQIPKFKIEQKLELSDTLETLGVHSLFGSGSDLSGFLKEGVEEADSVTLDKAIHQSFIDVNEEGSEAAAATALFGFRSARPLFHTHFIADHPFLYLIYDKPTDTILFFGVFQDPKL